MTFSKKYKGGKTSSVRNDTTDDICIGSTIMTLPKRMVEFRCDAKSRPDVSFFYTSMNETGIAHFYIELVENSPAIQLKNYAKEKGKQQEK